MSDDESGLKSCFSLLNFMSPLLSPEVLEGEEGVPDLVVHSHELLGLLLLNKVLVKLLHGARDDVEQVSGPGNAARDCGQVAHYRRVVLVLLVLVLNLVDHQAVVVEENGVLRVRDCCADCLSIV